MDYWAPPLRKENIPPWVIQPTLAEMRDPMFLATQTVVLEALFSPPAPFPNARTRHHYIALSLKATSHTLSVIYREVAGDDFQYENSSLEDAREIIRSFKRSGDESLLEEICQRLLNAIMRLYFVYKDEIGDQLALLNTNAKIIFCLIRHFQLLDETDDCLSLLEDFPSLLIQTPAGPQEDDDSDESD